MNQDQEIKRYNLKDKPQEKLVWWRDGMMLFMNLSGYVFGPLIIGFFVGKWIDTRYGTAPWGLVSLSLGAFVLSIVGIMVETVKYLKKVEKNDKK